MSQPTKMNRYVSRKKLSELAEDYSKKKDYYNAIYSIVYKNKRKPLEVLLDELSKTLKKDFTLSLLQKEIEEMNTSISTGKAHECDVIVKLAIAKKNNDAKEVVLYSGYLQLIEVRKEKCNERKEELRNSKTYIKNHDHEEKKSSKLDEATDLMNKIIKKEVEPGELDYKTLYSNLLELKRNLRIVDLDKYTDFIIKAYSLNAISDSELKQLREVVEYFLKGIDNNLMTIKQLDPDIDGNQTLIDKITVIGEENLDEKIKAYPRKVYNWKMNRLENKRDLYSHYLTMINELLVDKNFDSYKNLTSTDKKLLQEDEEFLSDYVTEFRKIGEVYNPHIKKVKTTTDENIAKLKLKFINKITGDKDE